MTATPRNQCRLRRRRQITAVATVYAKLYVSREGEPWSQYFTTSICSPLRRRLHRRLRSRPSCSTATRRVITPMLIEIYSLDHFFYMVASAVLLDYHTSAMTSCSRISSPTSLTTRTGEVSVSGTHGEYGPRLPAVFPVRPGSDRSEGASRSACKKAKPEEEMNLLACDPLSRPQAKPRRVVIQSAGTSSNLSALRGHPFKRQVVAQAGCLQRYRDISLSEVVPAYAECVIKPSSPRKRSSPRNTDIYRKRDLMRE